VACSILKQLPLTWFDHLAKFDCCVSCHVAYVGGPKNVWTLRPRPLEIADPLETYRSKFDHSRSNGKSVHTKICGENVPLTSRLSRSLKVIGTVTYQLGTYDF